jgi:hypothetical protein
MKKTVKRMSLINAATAANALLSSAVEPKYRYALRRFATSISSEVAATVEAFPGLNDPTKERTTEELEHLNDEVDIEFTPLPEFHLLPSSFDPVDVAKIIDCLFPFTVE